MEAIREFKKVKGRSITVAVPSRFKNLQVEIIILPVAVKGGKVNGHRENLMISESALRKDWDLPQEDKAWQSL